MLSEDSLLANVPFLYFSDHGFEGIQIFQVLKYGAVASAWASRIQVCSQLTWAGPSKDELLQSPEAYGDSFSAQYIEDNPHKSAEEASAALATWKEEMEVKIKKKLVAATKANVGLSKSFERLGWLQHEPGLSNEIQAMFDAPSKFRMVDLMTVSTRYVRMFLAQKVATSITTSTASQVQVQGQVPLPLPLQPSTMRSPIGRMYKNLPSQDPSSMPKK